MDMPYKKKIAHFYSPFIVLLNFLLSHLFFIYFFSFVSGNLLRVIYFSFFWKYEWKLAVDWPWGDPKNAKKFSSDNRNRFVNGITLTNSKDSGKRRRTEGVSEPVYYEFVCLIVLCNICNILIDFDFKGINTPTRTTTF